MRLSCQKDKVMGLCFKLKFIFKARHGDYNSSTQETGEFQASWSYMPSSKPAYAVQIDLVSLKKKKKKKGKKMKFVFRKMQESDFSEEKMA